MKWIYLLIIFLIVLSPLFGDPTVPYENNPDLLPIDGYVFFYDVQGSAAYVSSTPGELPATAVRMGRVYGQACQYGLSLPFSINVGSLSGKTGGAVGNGGYLRALNNIHKRYPEIEGIYDVQVDRHEVRILSIYSKLCTEITARGFKS